MGHRKKTAKNFLSPTEARLEPVCPGKIRLCDNPCVSVVMPAFLEAENLRILLPQLNQVMGCSGEFFEIIVVDKPKPLDDTPSVCKEYRAFYVPREGGTSYGSAVRTGIRAARGSWILFMDADGSHPPEFIPRLLSNRSGNDVVIASRYVEGGSSENNLSQRLMSIMLNLSYSWILGLSCKDVSNSFKLSRDGRLYCRLSLFKSSNVFPYPFHRNRPC